LVEQKKIETYVGFDLLNYPHIIGSMGFDLVLAPLQDNVFNRCKSNIKLLEMGALGIPTIVQDLTPYKKYTDLRFHNSNQLSNHIDTLLSSKQLYMDTVKKNRNMIDHGDSNALRGWWLEANMDQWFKLYCINQRTLRFDLRLADSREAQAAQQSKIEEIKFEV
jgi:hypothetical protein